MPTKCSVSGCENFYSRGVPFFDIPSPLKYKFSSEKADLSKKRRKLWLDAMGIKNDSSEILRICSKHFVTGKPATLEESRDVDWVPTLHMKLTSSEHKRNRKSNEDASKSGKDASKSGKASNQKPNSAKEIVKGNKAREGHNDKRNKTEGKVQKREIKNITKIPDLKKYLNCKVLLDGNIRSTTFKGTNGSGITIAQKHGDFTSDNVTVNETSINNTVLRIHLKREDLHELKRKYKLHCTSPDRTKRKQQKISSFGRQIKKKVHFFEESFVQTSSKKNTTHKTLERIEDSVSKTEKIIEKPVQNRSSEEDEYKNEDIIGALKTKQEVEKTIDNSYKTLNRVIKKSYRDKIKIKLFPRKSFQKEIINGSINNLKATKSLDLQRDLLFVNQLKNEEPICKLEKNYFLKFNPYKCPQEGKLNYSFQKLVTDVKHMKLPTPSWKIKVVIKQGKISAITFTNKLALERCVAFAVNSDRFRITIDNKAALLLGSPGCVRNAEDLEVLLDIVQNIDSANPMVFYK